MRSARARPVWIGVGAALLSLVAVLWADPGDGRAPGFVSEGSGSIEAILDALRIVDFGGALGTGLLGPVLLLGLAAAAAGFLPRTREQTSRASSSLPAGVEFAAFAALVMFQLGVALYRLGVHPDLDFDEMSYTAAARMQLGEIPAGSVFGAHPFSRFQAQPLPLWLHSAGVAAFGPGVLAVRLVSVLLGVATLLVVWWSLRPRLGPRTALAMAALCSTAPLWLASIRAGHYIAFSVLHSALCFAALLRLLDRRTLGSAAILGALLGASLYGYQISWFVPGLALIAGTACAVQAGAKELIGRAAVVACVALLTLLPGLLLLQGGLLAVMAQTLDKAVWSGAGAGNTRAWERPVLLLDVPGGSDHTVRGWIARVRGRDLDVTALPRDGSRGVFHVTGPPVAVAVARDEAVAVGGRVAFDGGERLGPVGQALRMAAQAAVGPSLEFAVRVDDGPLIDPWVLPWVLVGTVLAWRRRREPVIVALLVWTWAGLLLPAAIGGTVARRAVLILPFAFALAAIPIVEIGLGTRIGRFLLGTWIVLAMLSGTHTYFRHWHLDWRAVASARADSPAPALAGQVASGSLLELRAVLDAQPEERRILLPRLFRFFPAYWIVVAEQPDPDAEARISERVQATNPEAVAADSCAATLPVTWITRDDSEQRALFGTLAASFELEATTHGAYRVVRLTARRPGACGARR
jgi:4-amino-4-deoxy-L-arabinose transferase-like glycosyltransferase